MPNSTVYEKRNVLPGGGGSFPFIKPPTEAPTLQAPQMQPQLQTQPSPLGLKPVSQQMTEQATPTLSRNYFSRPQATVTAPTPTTKPTSTYIHLHPPTLPYKKIPLHPLKTPYFVKFPENF